MLAKSLAVFLVCFVLVCAHKCLAHKQNSQHAPGQRGRPEPQCRAGRDLGLEGA